MHSNKTLFPALLAVGGTLAAAPATAIELGDINVESTLGQPLRASIAYALAPKEQLSNYCVTLHQGPSANGLPAVQNATVSIAGGVISLTGRAVVREPLMSVRVNIACPYTPKLSREYMLFIDPTLPASSEVATTPVGTVETQAARPVAAAATRPATRRPAVASTPIAAETRYRVLQGDTLSGIASRIEDRPVGLWSAVSTIFDANPDAFIDNDPNKLKAGSWLAIPDFGNGAAVVADSPAFPAATSAPTVVTQTVEAPAPAAAVDDTNYLEPATTAPVQQNEFTRDLEPGDLVLDRENPFVDLADRPEAISDSNVGISDTSIDVATESASPNVAVARVTDEPAARPAPQQKTNWLLWTIGGGIALMAGLLLFGRRRRYDDSDPYADAEPAHPMRRSTDSVTVETLADENYDLDDDSPTSENLALDADLDMGTGLDEGTDIDVHQDFGFVATTDVDFDLTTVDEDEDAADTDMLLVPTIEQPAMRDSEVVAGDDDYDMSIIVDATKMPRPDDVTGRDLKAVAVENSDDTAEYTLDQEIDYQILEQDYEDELTATQALNKEIEKAAAELVNRIEAKDGNTDADDATAEMPLATVTEIDATSRLPADQVITTDDDETGVEITQEMPSEDKTVEMPKSDNDDTAEMTVESGKVDTKAG